MGYADDEWLGAQERGWGYADTFVCDECVLDEYLKNLIKNAVESCRCDYCGRAAAQYIAAPFAVIMDAVGRAFMRYFAEPAASGLPRDSGRWLVEDVITNTEDALLSFGVFCGDSVFAEIANSFTNDYWYPCADGHWMGVHPHEQLRFAWEHFVREVKYVHRYFFCETPDVEEYNPSEISSPIVLLEKIRDLVVELNLTKEFSAGQDLFRVREIAERTKLSTLEEIGAPPPAKARAGRMNPAGISYCYLSLERGTALGEVIIRPPCHAAIGHLRLQRSVRLVDLTSLPEIPSIFDSASWEDREHIIFLHSFVDAISQPIVKDGREHIEYVPSQIVCEYLAQSSAPHDSTFDGVLFPSAVSDVTVQIPSPESASANDESVSYRAWQPDTAGGSERLLSDRGSNLVLFPPRNVRQGWASILEVNNVEHISFGTWSDLVVELAT